jgi:predicted transcriptional regulator
MLARRRTSSRGSVTAEVALALPGVIIAAYLMMLGLVVVGQQVRCHSAASAVARAVARFESPAAVDRLASKHCLPVLNGWQRRLMSWSR